MSRPVHIAAVGARTPLGLTAESSAAAVRGRLSRLKMHPYFVDPTGAPLRGAIDGLLDPTLQGPTRLASLAAPALDEAVAKIPASAWRAGVTIPVLLSVPEHRPGFGKADEAALLAELQARASLPLSFQVAHRGHAGALYALAVATEWISAGRCDLCIVGGVETYFQVDTIDWLIANDQLAMEDGRSPFSPGEGAAFIVLASRSLLGNIGAKSLAAVLGAHSTEERSLIKTDDINLAKALTSAIDGTTARLRLPQEAVDDVWCDLNGERYRTDEWSYILLRLGHVFRQRRGEPTGYRSASDAWGDMGAASGALLVMLAVQSWQRLYAKGPRALVFAGSEQGLRSAVVLQGGVSA